VGFLLELKMKNSMLDLHNHLFAQLERLSDESIKGDVLREELSRAKAVMGVADVLVNNATLMLEAERLKSKTNETNITLPSVLSADHEPRPRL
jgi:hypothetical protein